MKKTFLLLLFSLFIGVVFAGNTKGWQKPLSHPFSRLSKDSVSVPGTTLVCAYAKGKGRVANSYPLYHLNRNTITIDIKASFKTKDCKNAFLILTSLDYGENAVSRDTLCLPLSDDLTTYSKSLTVRCIYALVVSLEVESADDDKEGVFSIADIDLSSGGEPLSEDAVGYRPPFVDEQDLVEWDNMLHLPFMDKTFLGFGETSHGTETYGQLTYEIMKERILHHRCKLILLELPVNDMLYINRYVKNDERFNIDSISTFLKRTFFAKSTIDFLRWVKTHNASHQNEISVLGFDLDWDPGRAADQMAHYIRSLNVYNVDAVNELCDSIAVKYAPEDVPSLLSMFDRTNLEGVLDREEVELIRYCISDLQNKERLGNRDLRMPQLVERIFSQYLTSDATVTFLGHLGHLNYLTRQCSPVFFDCFSMGNALRKKYGDDYCCIAVGSVGGEAFLVSRRYVFPKELESAPQESIEYQVGKWGKSPVFLSMEKMKSTDVYKVREVGQSYSNKQFNYLIPRNAMDGIIVVVKAERNKHREIERISF